VSPGARNVLEPAGPASTNARRVVERGPPQLARMFDRIGPSFFKFGRPSPKRLAKSVSPPPEPDFTSALDGICGHPIPASVTSGSNHAGPNRCLPYLTTARLRSTTLCAASPTATCRRDPAFPLVSGGMEHLPYSPRHPLLGARPREITVGGQPMIDRFRDFARALLTALLLGVTGAAAQTSQSLTSPPGAAPQGASTPSIQAGRGFLLSPPADGTV
jgi:hypothetical protein